MKEDTAILTACLIFVLGFLIAVVAQPYFEARTFNKFSDTKATYWDAVVCSLRVIGD